jgi:PAS domain S-box-containing protein
MDSWLQAFGATGLLFHAAALYVWITLRKNVDKSVWWSVTIGYIALLSHRANELAGWSNVYAQTSAVVIAYIALYAVLRAKRHIALTKAFSQLIAKMAEVEQPKRQMAQALAERLIELKAQVDVLQTAPPAEPPFRDRLATRLANHFIEARERLHTMGAQMQLYKDVADASPVPMVITDFNGKLTYANPAYLRFVGACLKDVLGEGWRSRVDPAVIEEVASAWQAAIQQESTHAQGAVSFLVDGVPIKCVYSMTRITEGYCGFILPTNGR